MVPAELTEIAWAAGFFDGEGTTNTRRTLSRGSIYWSVGLQVCQVRREPLDRFSAIVGEGAVRGPYGGNRANAHRSNAQPYFKWSIGGVDSTSRVLNLLWPYLSVPKREQAEFVWRQVRLRRSVNTQFPIPALAYEGQTSLGFAGIA